MYLTNVCFENYNKKDKSPCLFKRHDGPFLLVLVLVKRIISSVLDLGTFCGSWKQGFLRVTLENNLIDWKSRSYETI